MEKATKKLYLKLFVGHRQGVFCGYSKKNEMRYFDIRKPLYCIKNAGVQRVRRLHHFRVRYEFFDKSKY